MYALIAKGDTLSPSFLGLEGPDFEGDPLFSESMIGFRRHPLQ